MTMNTHPMHFVMSSPRASEFGQCLVSHRPPLALLIGHERDGLLSQKSHRISAWIEVKFYGASLRRRHDLRRERSARQNAKASPVPGQGIVTIVTRG